MTELRWEGDEENQYLFAGCNQNELAWLNKRTKHWSAAIWLPGLVPGKYYNTLAAQKQNIEAVVSHWFDMANTSVPATDGKEQEE